MLVMDIVFVTDFVCPYCLVAKEALAQAWRQGSVSVPWN